MDNEARNRNKVTKKKMSNEIKKSKSMDAKLLRVQTKNALKIYFESLNGHRPGDLYNLVLGQVEEPLFQAVMLGINRGTLRKKLKTYSIN